MNAESPMNADECECRDRRVVDCRVCSSELWVLLTLKCGSWRVAYKVAPSTLRVRRSRQSFSPQLSQYGHWASRAICRRASSIQTEVSLERERPLDAV